MVKLSIKFSAIQVCYGNLCILSLLFLEFRFIWRLLGFERAITISLIPKTVFIDIFPFFHHFFYLTVDAGPPRFQQCGLTMKTCFEKRDLGSNIYFMTKLVSIHVVIWTSIGAIFLYLVIVFLFYRVMTRSVDGVRDMTGTEEGKLRAQRHHHRAGLD